MSRRRYRTQTTARRRAALIGVAAILFQAFLFGWHHHALALPQSSEPIASVQSATQPLAPATAEELCEICAVLHQQSAAPKAVSAQLHEVEQRIAIHRLVLIGAEAFAQLAGEVVAIVRAECVGHVTVLL